MRLENKHFEGVRLALLAKECVGLPARMVIKKFKNTFGFAPWVDYGGDPPPGSPRQDFGYIRFPCLGKNRYNTLFHIIIDMEETWVVVSPDGEICITDDFYGDSGWGDRG